MRPCRSAADERSAPVASAAYFRAVAVDFDGTLAEDGRVAADTLAALRHVRARRVTVILVTGRILDELYGVFPDVDNHVDAVVAENGAVVSTPRGQRRLAAPVDPAVGEALTAKRVAWRAGQVLVGCSGADEAAVLKVVRGLGLDCQLVRNRGELMVLPAGITKGSGLFEALGDLGLSHHNTLGVGDAENDHSLLETCELGVAVANAVDAVRAHADVVLAEPNGGGVTQLLRSGLLTGEEHVHPRRWQLVLGIDGNGQPVQLPASQINVVVAGGTGEGKSYLAGLIAEQLVGLGYSLFVFDPEGDHVGLGQLRGVLVVDAHRETIAGEVVQLLRHRYATVVLDLSGLDPGAQARYVERLPVEIEAQRRVTGLPQWVVLDEAHGPLGRNGIGADVFDPAAKGYLLVTWRPEELSTDVVAGLDAVIALGSPHPAASLIDLTAAVADLPRGEVARLLCGPSRRAVLAWRGHPRRAARFTLGQRATSHFRHNHKYGTTGVDVTRRFYFRTVPDTPTGAVAANLAELEAELARCDRGVLRHHCPKHDFSRWIGGVFHDHTLAQQVAAAEEELSASSPAAVVEETRVGLVAALQQRRPRQNRPIAGGSSVGLAAR
jgi:hydroxymethylpyrimidine pyrophosphatase-like HAD family hydrolase